MSGLGSAGVPVAAVDCGTNSTRLLIARPGAGGRLETIEREATITRLGAGVDATASLAADAIERTVEVLRRYRKVMDAHGVERVRITATSAARDAGNRDRFFDAAEEVIGVRPELLTGGQEARLSFIGAASELDGVSGPLLVVDIGGGSTEFAVGTGNEPDAVTSIDLGCVRITEQYLHSDPPTPEELSAAISVTEAYLDDVVREVPAAADAELMVGLAGTVTTVAAVELGLPRYDRDRIHHLHLTRAAAEDVFRTLATEARADRISNPGLEEARADVIVGGCCVLVAVLRYFDFSGCLVSESDILDGLARSLLSL